MPPENEKENNFEANFWRSPNILYQQLPKFFQGRLFYELFRMSFMIVNRIWGQSASHLITERAFSNGISSQNRRRNVFFRVLLQVNYRYFNVIENISSMKDHNIIIIILQRDSCLFFLLFIIKSICLSH